MRWDAVVGIALSWSFLFSIDAINIFLSSRRNRKGEGASGIPILSAAVYFFIIIHSFKPFFWQEVRPEFIGKICDVSTLFLVWILSNYYLPIWHRRWLRGNRSSSLLRNSHQEVDAGNDPL